MQHRYLLVVRFALINAVAAALLAAAWLQGWLDGILNERFWELSALIFLVFRPQGLFGERIIERV